MAEKGFVYVLTNPAMPGIVKVGKTARVPDKRIRDPDLTSTGVPTLFVVEYYSFFEEMGRAEVRAHEILRHSRFGKEFFKVDVAQAIIAIESTGLPFTKLFSKAEDEEKARQLRTKEELLKSEEKAKHLRIKEESLRSEEKRVREILDGIAAEINAKENARTKLPFREAEKERIREVEIDKLAKEILEEVGLRVKEMQQNGEHLDQDQIDKIRYYDNLTPGQQAEVRCRVRDRNNKLQQIDPLTRKVWANALNEFVKKLPFPL